MLTTELKDRFWRDGFLIAPSGLPASALAALDAELDGWIEESRGHLENYGTASDGRARFDLEPGHSAESPRLRRVSNPVDVSAAFREVLWRGPLVEMVARLIGPDVRFHHCKLNIKLPGMHTSVGWHQDHAYDPHSNDDMLAALLLLDDMDVDNGSLCVVPGSHREARYSHFLSGRFTGAVPKSAVAGIEARAVPVAGRRGDVCFIHTWTVHGSPPNASDRPRRLLICDYVSADAKPLKTPMLDTVHSGRLVHGREPGGIRVTQTDVEVPPGFEEDSFFGLQAEHDVSGAKLGGAGG